MWHEIPITLTQNGPYFLIRFSLHYNILIWVGIKIKDYQGKTIDKSLIIFSTSDYIKKTLCQDCIDSIYINPTTI